MRIDLSRERSQAWLICVAALVLALGVLWLIYDPKTLAAAAQKPRTATTKGTPLHERIKEQRAATERLRDALEQLKAREGFQLSKDFQVLAGSGDPRESEPIFRFKTRLTDVSQRVIDAATPRSVQWTEFLGFPNKAKVDEEKVVPRLLASLQLTDKAASVALTTKDPIEALSFQQARPEITGSQGRPPLIEEYPLTMTVRGPLKAILEILHRVTRIEDPNRRTPDIPDFPLIVRSLHIDGENPTSKSDITQLIATFELAGMRFLTPEERGEQPRAPRPTPRATTPIEGAGEGAAPSGPDTPGIAMP
jgi:hypothetical protein